MPHNYNKEAFGRIGNDSSNPLCAVYCSLIVLELAIKDHFYTQVNPGSWRTGHSIIDWLTSDLNQSSLGSQLANKLAALRCTDRNGNEVSVNPNLYPDLRYLRHEQDFHGKSTDAELIQVMGIIQDIQDYLKTTGIIV